MHRVSIACGLLLVATMATAATRGELLLADQPIAFDSSFAPLFTAAQIANTTDATRVGLARWASTEHGRKLLGYFTSGAYRISISEGAVDGGVGSAPQPGIATLLAANDDAVIKSYTLVLNPRTFTVPRGMVPLPGQPATPADVMAVAWAAELLHIYFYSRGISLPHHPRDDFQSEWQTIAAELGYPGLRHDDDDDPPPLRRRVPHPPPRRPRP